MGVKLGNTKKDIDMNKMNEKKMKKQLDKDNPIITAPMIDKLSGVINLTDKQYAGQVFSNMLHLINEKKPDMVKVPAKGKYQLGAKLYYPMQGELVHSNCPFIHLSMTHPSQSKAQVRFEYNPAFMTEAGENYLNVQLQSLFGVGFYELLFHARFTKVDVCRNIMGRSVEDYVYKAKGSMNSSCHFGKDGKLATLMLGQSSSTQSKIYDKAKQLHGIGVLHETIRVEVSCKTNLDIYGLAKMGNPFDRVQIFGTDWKNPPFGMAHGRAFLDSCRLRGVHNAIKHQPAQYRYKLKKYIAEQPVEWWAITPEDWCWLWADALENAGLLQIPNWAPPLTIQYTVGMAA